MADATSSENNTDEQEFLVYVDFEGSLLSNDLDERNVDIHVIGIDSENPVIEINGKIFEGTYDFSLGTNVFFEKDENHPPIDPLYDLCPKEMYKLYAKTNKVLKMRRMLVETNQSNETENKEETLEELKERLKTDMTYTDALNLLLSPGNDPPRQLEMDLIKEMRNEEKKNENSMEIDDNGESDEENKSDPDYVPENDT